MNKVNDLTIQEDWAIFLPSISSLYTKLVSKDDADLRGGKIPSGLNTVKDMNFLDPNGLFHYPYALYSAGHAYLDTTKSDVRESMIQKRNKKNTLIVGDSGGYQIATGVLNVDWNDPKAVNQIRTEILNWLEHTADWSMILDVPTKAIANERASNINTFEDCLKFTLDNAEYIMNNRQGKTKFLNVIQGIQPEQNKHWYDEIKKYNDPKYAGKNRFEGWAFGGTCAGNNWMAFQRLLEMRDEHEFEYCDWVHFLGVGRIWLAPVYNTLQRIIREKYNPNFTVSYDAASPYVCVAHGRIYDGFILEGIKDDETKKKKTGRVSLPLENFVDSKDFLTYNKPWPIEHNSPFAQRLLVNDICVNPKKEVNSAWDGYAYGLLMGHNTYILIHAIQTMNRMHDAFITARKLGDERTMKRLRARIAPNIIEMCDKVEQMFETKTKKDRKMFFVDNKIMFEQYSMSPTKDYTKFAELGDLFTSKTDEITGKYEEEVEINDPVESKSVQDTLANTGDNDLFNTK